MLNWVNIMIRFQVDYTRLIYYRGQLWNRSSWCRNCNVYNTLKESQLWLRAVFEHMTNFTTIHTSTCITMSVDLVCRQTFLGFVPRFVVLAIIDALPFGVLVEGNGHGSLFKVCFSVLRMSPRFHSVRHTFTVAGSKATVTDKSILPKTGWLKSLRHRWWHRSFTLAMVRIITSRPRCNNCWRAPQWILSTIILQID